MSKIHERFANSKEKTNKLKSSLFANMITYEDEVDNKVKRCEILDKWRLCFVLVLLSN